MRAMPAALRHNARLQSAAYEDSISKKAPDYNIQTETVGSGWFTALLVPCLLLLPTQADSSDCQTHQQHPNRNRGLRLVHRTVGAVPAAANTGRQQQTTRHTNSSGYPRLPTGRPPTPVS
jgi:hypothetical protein